MNNNNTTFTDGDTQPYQDVPLWIQVTVAIYLIAVHVIGVPSNIIAAIIYVRTSPKTACDWLILTMSITDAFVCYFSPILLVKSYFKFYIPWSNSVVCGMEYWLQLTAMNASCVLLVTIAVDRYLKICWPRQSSLTPVTSRNVCLLCIIISGTICTCPLLIRVDFSKCYFTDAEYNTGHVIFYTLMLCLFVLSFFIVTIAYACICKKIFDKIKRKKRLLEENGLTSPIKSHNKHKGIINRPRQALTVCQNNISKWRNKLRRKFNTSNDNDNTFHGECLEKKCSNEDLVGNKANINIKNVDVVVDEGTFVRNSNFQIKRSRTGVTVNRDVSHFKNKENELICPHQTENLQKDQKYNSIEYIYRSNGTENVPQIQQNDNNHYSRRRILLNSEELICDSCRKHRKANNFASVSNAINSPSVISLSILQTGYTEDCIEDSSLWNKINIEAIRLRPAYSLESIFMDRKYTSCQKCMKRLWASPIEPSAGGLSTPLSGKMLLNQTQARDSENNEDLSTQNTTNISKDRAIMGSKSISRLHKGDKTYSNHSLLSLQKFQQTCLSHGQFYKTASFVDTYHTNTLTTNNCLVEDDDDNDDDEVITDVSNDLSLSKYRHHPDKCHSKNCRKRKNSIKSTTSRSRYVRERQMTCMLISVTSAFLLSWLPPWIIYMLCINRILDYTLSSVYTLLCTTHLIHYVASPIIYYTFNPTFKSKVKTLFTPVRRRSNCSKIMTTSDSNG